MVGAPIEQVQDGMRTIIQNLRTDPYALETVFVSIIVFAGKAKVLAPLTELYKFYPPKFPIGGGTSLGAGLQALMDDIEHNVVKTTAEAKGDWKPIVFLFTDGNPTDNYAPAVRRWNDHFRRRCNLVAVSLGDNVNMSILGQLTENVLRLKDTDAESFSRFFKWVTASIQTTSVSVSDGYSDDIKLAPTHGINLEKVENPERESAVADENFAILYGRCSSTGHDYLMKYARRRRPMKGLERFIGTDFALVGAYPIDEEEYASLSAPGQKKVNGMELTGAPACPCCGNQVAGVVCPQCEGIFCGSQGELLTCPWCGSQGYLGGGVAGSLSGGLG